MPLSRFSPATRDWFKGAFEGPTPAQEQAWPAIASGEHVLISAPTGSGKTLAAFLYAIDRLAGEDRAAEDRRIGLVYVSPLKALSYDIDRNLRAPLRGIGADLKVAVRTGDTPQRERQAMLREPPDILITTPESLYLMLTGRAQELFAGARWCIVDEIHAVAATKRGAHLALTLERLTEAAGNEVQRIGLSATQKPLEEVGRFMVGPRRTCRIVDTGVRKELDLRIQVPVESMVEPDATPAPDLDPLLGGSEATRRSIWPAIYPELLKLIAGPPLDDPVRQQPPRRRAAGATAQRPRRARDRPRPPRLAGPRGADGRRGDAQGRRAAVPGGDLVARARDRHGRGRPGDPGRVAEVGGPWPAADRPRRPLGRRHQPRADLPQVPRRPARVRGGGQADAAGRDRDDRGPAQRARRARPADRGDRRRGPRRLARSPSTTCMRS